MARCRTNAAADHCQVQMRPFPYPYRAMLAVCSDLDGTPDARAYWEIARFLNTAEATAIGPGVDLEVGNSVYFDMPHDEFSYWNTGEWGRAMIRTLIRSGHIDCLHSYGTLATGRDHAARALDELARHDCRLEVWVDHGRAPTNFDPGIMCGHGDEPGHPAYHADLTVSYGIRYMWRGRVTSVIGQDAPPDLAGLFHRARPLASARTLAKEGMKRLLGRCGSGKYAMHAANDLLRLCRLRDGREVCEFLRANPHWGGVSAADTGSRIGEVLTDRMLRRLVERQSVCLLYTHLGKWHGGAPSLTAGAVAAFRRLAESYGAGRILVASSRRVLRYCRARMQLRYTAHACGQDGQVRIDIEDRRSGAQAAWAPADLDGLTFYAADPGAVRVCVSGREVRDLRRNPPDHTGRPSVSFPWPKLAFPSM